MNMILAHIQQGGGSPGFTGFGTRFRIPASDSGGPNVDDILGSNDIAYSPEADCFVYVEANGGGRATVRVLTVDRDNGNITSESYTIFDSERFCLLMKITYDPNQQRFLVIYNESNTQRVYGRSITINSATLAVTIGARVVVLTNPIGETDTPYWLQLAYDNNTNKFLALLYDHDTSTVTGRVITMSATGTLTSGANTTIDSSSRARAGGGLAFDESKNKFVFVYNKTNNPKTNRGKVLTISGTSISQGAIFDIISSDTVNNPVCVYHPIKQKVYVPILGGRSASPFNLKISEITISGTTGSATVSGELSPGSATQYLTFPSSDGRRVSNWACYDPFSDSLMLQYQLRNDLGTVYPGSYLLKATANGGTSYTIDSTTSIPNTNNEIDSIPLAMAVSSGSGTDGILLLSSFDNTDVEQVFAYGTS